MWILQKQKKNSYIKNSFGSNPESRSFVSTKLFGPNFCLEILQTQEF